MRWVLNFDGACEPNPGLGSWGYVVTRPDDGQVFAGGFLGDGVTNNVAEYAALGNGLKAIKGLVPAGQTVYVRGDSQLVINQVAGSWQCRNGRLQKCLDRVNEIVADLTAAGVTLAFEWVPRECNADADEQSRTAWEAATGRTFPERR